ncbi:Helix-turn-helix domain protein [compost metagenome]
MGAYFGQRLQEHRKARGLKSGVVAEALGLHKSNYSAYEAGRRVPSDDFLMALAAYEPLGLTYDLLKTWADLDKLGLSGIQRLKTHARDLIEGTYGPVSREWFGEVPFEPTEDELALINRARETGMTFPIINEPGFWGTPPEQRRKAFALLECLLDETAKYLPASTQLLKTQ